MLARFRFATIVFLGGAVLMALEILGSRLLAPHFGSSVYVWGSIISVFLAALSVGYVWGGRLADREPTLAGLGRAVVFAGVGLAVLLLFGPRLAALLGGWTGPTPLGTLLAATVLFAPSSVLLATLSPYAIRLAAHDLDRVGGTAGRLYALSTAGSLAGTLVCTFGLVQWFSLSAALAILVATTASTAFLALASAGRREAPSLVLALGLLVLAAFGHSRGPSQDGVVYERMTPYQTIRVEDRSGVRYLSSDRVLHGAVRRSDGQPVMYYIRTFPILLAYQSEARSLLYLGMGSGQGATYLQDRVPSLSVDLVEVDPAMVEVASRFLGFTEGPNRRVHRQDARTFLAASEERWDVIVADTYIGLSVPFHLTTREFLAEVRRHLTDDGVFVINLASGLGDPFPRAIAKTVLEEFPGAVLVRVGGSSNLLLIARVSAVPIPEEELQRRARDLDARCGFDLPRMVDVLGKRIQAELDLSDVPVLEDAYAPVESLLQAGAGR
jgi:spermidine synthase